MSKFRLLLLSPVIFSGFVVRAAEPAPSGGASEASAKELLELSGAHRQLEALIPQVDANLQRAVQQAGAGQSLTDEQKAILAKAGAKISELVKQEMTWDKIYPRYVPIYEKLFTQEEIDGINAFYKTPAGIALNKNMTSIMQQVNTSTQQMMAGIMQQAQVIMQATAAEIKTAAPKPEEKPAEKEKTAEPASEKPKEK